MKISYGEDKPYHVGWKGWRDNLIVHVDGAEIGSLVGTGHNKAFMDYGFRGYPGSTLGQAIESHWPRIAEPTGRRAAKDTLARLVGKVAP